MIASVPRIRAVRARALSVPVRRPLATAGGMVTHAAIVLIDLETEEGIAGASYAWTPAPYAVKPLAQLVEALGEMLKGDPVAPVAIEQKLRKRLTLLQVQGLQALALSGIDVACWDVAAKAAGQPLARLLGGVPRPIPAYNSNGLGIMGPERAAAEAVELAAPGFKAIKVRLGYPTIAEDVAVVRAVRRAVGDAVILMSDYNQALLPPEAEARARALDAEGLAWIEEPVRFDDYAGCARVAAAAATPIQIGESCWGVHDMQKALDANACDLFMPDLGKIGGVTGWLRAAALAEPRGLPISTHLFPEVSAHLMAVTPTAHWLEYMDWASPILAEPLELREGNAIIPERPGNGLAWNEAAVARFLVP
jgi:mandelate racemase